jgi:hypothetical protein
MSLTHDDVINGWFGDAIEYAIENNVPLRRLRELIIEMTTPCPPFEVFDDADNKLAEFQTEEEARDALVTVGYYAVDAVGNTLDVAVTAAPEAEWQIKGKDFD